MTNASALSEKNPPLVDARISASDIDLPVNENPFKSKQTRHFMEKIQIS